MLEISKTDVLKSLRRDNPWWNDSSNESRRPVKKKRAYFAPFVALALDWTVWRSTTLMGPRRVGKTVMLRQMIEQAIMEGFDGRNILYVSIDTPLYSGMPLSRLIELFEEDTYHDPHARRIIVLTRSSISRTGRCTSRC